MEEMECINRILMIWDWCSLADKVNQNWTVLIDVHMTYRENNGPVENDLFYLLNQAVKNTGSKGTFSILQQKLAPPT